MKLLLIAALGRNRVIGNRGDLPWDLPEDMRMFMQRTKGHTVLMGRTTFDLLPAPLPDRRNIVLTHRPLSQVESFSRLDEALEAVRDEDEVYVTGGGTVYEQTISIADGMVLSHVHADPEGDAFFPEFEHLIGTVFEVVERKEYEGFDLVEYERKSTSANSPRHTSST